MHSHQGREDPGPANGKCPPGKGEQLDKIEKVEDSPTIDQNGLGLSISVQELLPGI